MLDPTSAAPLLRVECPDLPASASPLGLDGEEGIHRLFDYRVMVELPEGETLDPMAVIGSAMTVVMVTDERPSTEIRRLHGIVAGCEDYLRPSTSLAYRLRVVPRMWLSTLVETLEIYQEMSIVDIITAKLKAIHLESGKDFEFRLGGSYAPREFVVQYKETDFAFISRLCEHIGISFFFEHRDDRDVAVFTDSGWGFKPIAGDAVIPFFARGTQRGIHELQRETQIVPSTFLQRDYNYRNPSTDLLAEDKFDGFGGGIVEYGGHFRDAAEGKALAAVRRQEKECRQLLYRGKSADCRVSAGQKFSITGHLYGDVELLPSVTRVTCKSADLTAEGSAHYEVAFVAIDGNMTFRPERVTPRPHIKGMLTGIIDAAGPGQYAEVDDMGRYKVRFMFDTSGPDGGKASRPVRMMQPHAGGGYGMHFPLRGGVEVLITFIDGDPDRPIIAGTVPNPQTPSPVSAANARRNVLRTGAGNEMNIDDTVGSERIKFTVPHGNTVFQLGAPNLAESGAALATTGAFTATATAGTSMVGGFHAGLSAISSWFGSGNIVSEASKMSIGTFLLSGGQALSALASAAAAAIAGYKGALEFSEKRALRNGVAAQDKATKKWQSCDACTKDLEQRRAGLPPELQVTAIALEEQQKAANAAYADSLDTRRKRDQSREASVGLWTDQNEVAHTRRAARLDEQYQQERGQAQSALSAARRAQDTFATTLADAARDPNLSLEQQRAIMEYRDALGACGNDCDGLAADQVNADKELKKYHDMRADHSDEHAWIQSAEKTVGATAAVVGATTQLMSTILALASLAKKKEAQIKLTSRWARLSGNLRKSDNASRASISVSPSTPLHAVGATGSATLFGKDVAIEGDMVGIYASGTKGHVAVNGKKKATLSAKDRTEVSSTDVTFVQGQEVKLQGWDGRSKGPFFVINPDNTGNRFMLKNRDWTLSGDDKAVKLGKNGAWEIKLDDKGIDAGKKDAGEIDLSATKAVVKKKSTQLTLEDEKGVLKSKVCHIEGQNTKCKVSESQITLDAQGRINLEAKKVDVKAKSIALNGAKVDLG